jgi:adenine-specific DNA-methyltransferase
LAHYRSVLFIVPNFQFDGPFRSIPDRQTQQQIQIYSDAATVNLGHMALHRKWSNAVREAEWRLTNRAYCGEATSLLQELGECRDKPSVIYADPPYTGDQYSRYYHLLETMILYDYPDISSKGQYRSNRYSSRFSMKTTVEAAFAELVAAAAKLDSTIVISYPEKGLLDNPRPFLCQLLASHYRKSGVVAEIDHQHSSLGGSKGQERSAVTEIVYLGSQ